MLTRFLALMITFCALMLLVVVGNTAASNQTTPTPAGTTVAALTEEPTAEATEAALVGDPVRGDDIFRHGLDGAPPCITCHSPVVAGRGTMFAIGPGLKGISERGATRVEGFTAPEYIEDSIRHPAHYVVSGYNPIMPTIFGEQYSDQDVADLAAFLMTL